MNFDISRILSGVVLMAVTLCSMNSAYAGKVVYADMRQVIMASGKVRAAMKALQSKPEFAKLAAENDSLVKEYQDLLKERESKGLTWSAEQKAENQKKAGFLESDIKSVRQKMQAEQASALQGVLVEAEKALPAVIDQLVKSDGIDVFLRSEALAGASKEANYTAKAVAALNKALESKSK